MKHNEPTIIRRVRETPAYRYIEGREVELDPEEQELLSAWDELVKLLERTVFVAEHLFQMVPQEEWRRHGVEYMGAYEGDHHAEQVGREIRKWKELLS